VSQANLNGITMIRKFA